MLVHFIDRLDDFVLNNAYKIHGVLRRLRCKIVDLSYRNERTPDDVREFMDDYYDSNDYH